MIIDFSFENFRSFKEKTAFTLRADALTTMVDNVFEADIAVDNSISLLKTAVVYGANASGKSNFIKAFFAFTWLIKSSHGFEIHKNKIDCYEPYELDVNTENAPVNFKISFILNTIKYDYEVSFKGREVLLEKLDFYPKGQPANLFTRGSDEIDYDLVKLGKSVEDKKIPKRVFKNQLYLSRFGVATPHKQLTSVYKYLTSINVWNAHDKFTVLDFSKEMSLLISQAENEDLKNRLSKLIKISDTKIESIDAKELNKEEFQLPSEVPDRIVDRIYENNKIQTFSYHKRFDGKKEVDLKEFNFNEKESMGTKVLFALGGKILQTLESGGVFIIDELDNSLHPKLCKFLIRLFNNRKSNPKNAQLIFATHEVTLLDENLFRKDQIWFTQKDKYGSSDLYCVNEFEGVRNDTNFELWYRTGKFGGNPKIKEVEFIYE